MKVKAKILLRESQGGAEKRRMLKSGGEAASTEILGPGCTLSVPQLEKALLFLIPLTQFTVLKQLAVG